MAVDKRKARTMRSVFKREYIIRPRERKERKHYTDDWAFGEEEIEGRRTFHLDDKMESSRFPQCFVKEMQGSDLTLSYIQKHGFNVPLLFRDKAGLGLRVPSQNFTVKDVRMCVGSRRIVDVMDVNTQKNVEMTMKEWQKYYDDENKDKLLNVISLEFSHTKLENYIQTPTLVRQIDWVDCVWPKHLKEAQTESTNVLDEMMYPKVQKYCLMSVKGCYTDFHVDFGGTSVWYHILKGSKIFWLIPPTERNLQLYEQWVLSGKQSDIFFGDTVEKCGRVTLTAGNTFFIPTGWIHAVYTPVDSLVFGGNFLHSFGIEKQLKTAHVEDATHVPQKFRYPFFTEMLWYVLERYVHSLLGRSHLDKGGGGKFDTVKPFWEGHVHLTSQELHGLKAIVMFLHALPTNKKNVPDLIKDPIALIKDVRTLVEQHRYDSPDAAVTGKSVLWSFEGCEFNEAFNGKDTGKHSAHRNSHYASNNLKHKSPRGGKGSNNHSNSGPRRRRTRCKKCEACERSDCGDCSFCQDMVKFGGSGRAKQTCVMRQCLQPMLPVTAACISCGLDGWGQQPVIPIQKVIREISSNLMECSVCYEIIHPDCMEKLCPGIEGVVNEDLPNSWECPKCCKDGKNVEYKPRHFRARQKSCDIRRLSLCSDTSSLIDCKDGLNDTLHSHSSRSRSSTNMDVDEDSDAGVDGLGQPYECGSYAKRKKLDDSSAWDDATSSLSTMHHSSSAMSDDGSTTSVSNNSVNNSFSGNRANNNSSNNISATTSSNTSTNAATGSSNNNNTNSTASDVRKMALRTQLAHQLTSNSTRILRKPSFVVRPAIPLRNNNIISQQNFGKENKVSGSLALERECLLPVFKFLSPAELSKCALVCRSWYRYSVDPCLWKLMDLSHHILKASHLAGIARRQPETLVLDWTSVGKRQLAWLIGRLPQMRELSLQGCMWAGVSALRTCVCPPLASLDLSYVSGMNDAALRDVLSPPPDSRPGLIDTKSRLRNLRTLRLAGCDITDISLRYVTQHLPQLTFLDVSSCSRITDAGVAQLATPTAPTIHSLHTLDLSSCRLVTDASLEHLTRCEELTRLDLRHTPLVTAAGVAKFTVRSRHELKVMDGKLIAKRPGYDPSY